MPLSLHVHIPGECRSILNFNTVRPPNLSSYPNRTVPLPNRIVLNRTSFEPYHISTETYCTLFNRTVLNRTEPNRTKLNRTKNRNKIRTKNRTKNRTRTVQYYVLEPYYYQYSNCHFFHTHTVIKTVLKTKLKTEL